MPDGGTGKAIQTLHSESRHTKRHFQNSCYHCNFPLLYLNIHHYSIKGQDFRVQLDARQWLVEGLGQRKKVGTDFAFRNLDFRFQILSFSLIEILLINQEVGNKKWSKTEGIFCTQYLNLFTWYYRRYQAVRFLAVMKVNKGGKKRNGGTKFKIRNSYEDYESAKKRIQNFKLCCVSKSCV